MKARLRRLLHLDRFDRRVRESLEEEVSFHLDTRIEQLIEAGLSPDEARAEALRRFGDPDLVRARCRSIDRRGARRRAFVEFLSDLLLDVRLALRGLAGARGYTAVVVLSLTVGIGTNAALFTAIRAVWFAPVPGVTGQDRVADMVTVEHGAEEWGWAYPDFVAVKEADGPLEAVTAWTEKGGTVGTEEGGRSVRVAYVTSDYFRVLGAAPVVGRGFVESDDAGPGEHPVVVVSHDFWVEQLDGRRDVVGRAISLNRMPYTVVGVAPEGFRGARVTLSSVDLWVPLVQHREAGGADPFLADRNRLAVQVLGRLRPGATLSEAQAAARTVFARLAAEYPESNGNRTVRAAAFMRFPAQNRMGDMLAVAGIWGLLLVLLVTICGNLAGITLARAASREREIGVRLALGASRVRLARNLLVEAFVLALAGGGLGLGLAWITMGRVSPASLGVVAPGVSFEPGLGTVVVSMALALAAALAFGLLPALRFSRPVLVSALKDEARGGGSRVGRVQRIAASTQTGAALFLLLTGALFLRSLERMQDRDLGYEPDGMLLVDFWARDLSSGGADLAEMGYPTVDEGGGFMDRVIESVGNVPGVASVALADGFPLDLVGSRGWAGRADRPDESQGRVRAEVTRGSEGYFTAVGAPILQGRGFLRSDDATSEPVAVVTRSLVDRLWPGEDPLGRRLLWPAGSEGATARTVVGVAGDVASSRATEDWPQVFLPLRQDYTPHLLVVVRGAANADALSAPIRAALRGVDPGLPAPRLVPASVTLARSTQEQRAAGRVGGSLGVLILLLSAMGLYGVVALAVARRTREIGVRLALGATRGAVLRGVLGDALRLAAPGLAGGAIVAVATAAGTRSMLLGMSPVDPLSFAGAGGLLLAVVALAAFLPARRASAIQPVDALRME